MPVIDPKLSGRVALVTGANHGIGEAAARALGAQGCAVFCTYLRDYLRRRFDDEGTPDDFFVTRERSADHVVADLEAEGARAASAEFDLSDPHQIPDLFDAAESALGPIDILVLNAAASEADTFRDHERDGLGRELDPFSSDTHDNHFDTNSRGNALCIAEFARRYRARGASSGRIIALTSGGPSGFPGEVSYGASKAALESYVYSAALESAELGITANVVYPPVTDTGWITDANREAVAATSVMGHIGTPEEVAEVIVFLASHQARLITGQRIKMA